MLGLYATGGAAFVLGFVALVPWLLALEAADSAAAAARSGWTMSVALVAAVFAWFGLAVAGFTGMPPAAGLLLLLAAAPLLQPQLIAFALVRHIVGRRHGRVLRALAGAAAWVATECFLPKLLGDTLGHGLQPSLLLRQSAEIGGAAGLSLCLLLVNECVAAAIARRHDGARAVLVPLAGGAAIVMGMAGFGAVQLRALDAAAATSADAPLRVGLVQSNIVDYERLRREKGAYAVVRDVLDTHYAMSREAVDVQHVDALVWSETVYPTTFGHPKSVDGAALDRELLDFVASAGVPLVFGTYDRDGAGEYNAAAFVEPGADKALGYYRKTDLFPLTEYVPHWLDGPSFRRWFPWTGRWQRGDGARVFPWRLRDGREVPVLPLVCLDDVDSDLAIDGARLGARLIVTLSNDAWFTAHPEGARLHLAVATFRSIETRLPQLRATSNGISAVIDETGAVRASTGIGERRLLVAELRPRDAGATLAMAWGDWVGRAGLGFLLLLAGMALGRAWQARQHARFGAVPPRAAAVPLVLVPLRGWRLVVLALHALAGAGMAWLLAGVLRGDATLLNPLAQLRWFASLVALPTLGAWALARGRGGAAGPASDHVVALPGRPAWLARAALAHARLRASVPRTRLDAAWLRFVVFPLVPALPAFRLHQHIAFGGTFGEYQTFGLQAYVGALLLWWASWAISLVLLAAALRVLVEMASLVVLAVAPARAVQARAFLEASARLLYYVGVPAWLLVHAWPA